MAVAVVTNHTLGGAQEGAGYPGKARVQEMLGQFGKVLHIGMRNRENKPQTSVFGWRTTSLPKDYHAMRMMVGRCIASKEYMQALEHLAQIAKMAPNYAKTYIDMGSVRTKIKDDIGAIEKYEFAIGLIESGKARYAKAKLDHARAYKKMGTAHLRLGDKQEAAKCLRTSIRLYEKLGDDAAHDINYAKAQSWLGEMLLSDGRESEAKALFERAVAACPHLEKPSDHLRDMWNDHISGLP